MSDLVAKLRLQAADEGLSATATKAAASVDQLGKSAGGAKGQLDQASSSARSAEGNLRQLETAAERGSRAMEGLAAAIGLVGLKEIADQIKDAAVAWQGYETGLTAVTGGHANAASTIDFLREQSARLGLVVKDQIQGFIGLASATHLTSLQGEQTRQIWLGLNEAGAAQHLTSDKMSRAMEALNQIAGKGVVSMQDLRQQLAQDLPGAAEVAQRAMGMTGAQFNQMVSTGKLLAEDFLPKFAAQLRKEYGPALEQSLTTPVGQARLALAAMKNELFDVQTAAGQGFLGGVVAGVDALNSSLKKGGTIEAARELGFELGQLVGVGASALSGLAQHGQEIVTVMTVLGGLKVASMIAGWGAEAVTAAGEVGLLEAATAALGGPLGIVAALVGGGLALGITAYGHASAQAAAEQSLLAQHSRDANDALQDARKWLDQAASTTGQFGDQARDANKWVEELTGKVGALADQIYRVAAANKEVAINQLLSAGAAIQADISKLDDQQRALPGSGPNFDETGASLLFQPDAAGLDAKKAAAQSQLDQINAKAAALAGLGLDAFYDQPKKQPGLTKPDKSAEKQNRNLADEIASQQRYTAALLAGGKALDDWKVADAGRQAVDKAGLGAAPALIASIRSRAEQLERLKIDNERLTQADQLKRQADLDTAALKGQAAAYMQGEQAAEDYQVKQAGLQVLQQLHVQTLDQLTGATRTETEAAIASAEAKERQTIATQKAQKVASALQDLDRQIAAEKAHTASLLDGTKAEVDYARAEFERQEIERAGTNLTAEQIAQIKAKADLLFQLQGQTALGADAKQQAEDLKTAGMTADEREREARALQLSAMYMQAGGGMTQAQADAMAQSKAAEEQLQRQRQTDLGQLREGLRQTFIDSGKLGFDEVGDYATKRLRQAVYDALLAKPIDMVINAVVGSVSGLAGNILGLSGAGSAVAGGTGLLGGGINALGLGGAAASLGGLLGLGGGAAAGAAGAGAVAGMGGASMTAAEVAAFGGSAGGVGAAGGMAGLLGGAMGILGPAAILAGIGYGLSKLFGPKPSNFTASAVFTGQNYALGGDKPDAATTSEMDGVAKSIQQTIQSLDQLGVNADNVLRAVEVGARDPAKVVLNSGQTIYTPKGDTQALTDAISHALLQNATYQNQSLKGLVDQMLAANKSFDDISKTLQTASDALSQLKAAGQSTDLSSAEQNLILSGATNAAAMIVTGRTFSSNLDKAMLQFTDPAAYAKSQATDKIDADYYANKAQAQDLISAGLLSPDVLGKLDQLHTLQLQDALNNLGSAANSAADALGANGSLQKWLDGLDVGSNSTLGPQDQRASAYAAYERELAQAQAHDPAALQAITGYADQLLSVDKNATTNAQDRIALANQVKSDIEALLHQSVSDVLHEAAATASATVAATVSAAVAAPQTTQATTAVQQVADVVSAKMDGVADGLAELQAVIEVGLASVAGNVSDSTAATLQSIATYAGLAQLMRAQAYA